MRGKNSGFLTTRSGNKKTLEACEAFAQQLAVDPISLVTEAERVLMAGMMQSSNEQGLLRNFDAAHSFRVSAEELQKQHTASDRRLVVFGRVLVDSRWYSGKNPDSMPGMDWQEIGRWAAVLAALQKFPAIVAHETAAAAAAAAALKETFLEYKRVAQKTTIGGTYDWSWDERSSDFDRKLVAWNHRRPANTPKRKWKGKKLGKSRRIFMFWKYYGRKAELPEAWSRLARVAAINQASTATCERDFSLVTPLVDLFGGGHASADMIKARLREQHDPKFTTKH